LAFIKKCINETREVQGNNIMIFYQDMEDKVRKRDIYKKESGYDEITHDNEKLNSNQRN
jgi:hypothetical protein